MIEVILGPDEVAIARMIGSRRYSSCRKAGSEDVHYPHDPAAEEQDQHAAGAEIAVARHYGKYPSCFSSVGSSNNGGDVGNVQVRHTKHLNGSLPIYEESKDDQPFMLVVGELPGYLIVGWIYAGEAKTDDRWRTTWPSGKPMLKPCWVVSQNDRSLRRVGV